MAVVEFLRPPRLLFSDEMNDLNPPEVRDIMKKVDDAIEAVEKGEAKEAAKKLEETAAKLEDKLEGKRLTRATAALQHLADLLGVSLEDDGD